MNDAVLLVKVAVVQVNTQVSKLTIPNVSGIGLLLIMEYHYC